jgi:hypothetical protein
MYVSMYVCMYVYKCMYFVPTGPDTCIFVCAHVHKQDAEQKHVEYILHVQNMYSLDICCGLLMYVMYVCMYICTSSQLVLIQNMYSLDICCTQLTCSFVCVHVRACAGQTYRKCIP